MWRNIRGREHGTRHLHEACTNQFRLVKGLIFVTVTLVELLLLYVFVASSHWLSFSLLVVASSSQLLFLMLSTIIESHGATMWRLSTLRPWNWKSRNKIRANVDPIYRHCSDQNEFHHTTVRHKCDNAFDRIANKNQVKLCQTKRERELARGNRQE